MSTQSYQSSFSLAVEKIVVIGIFSTLLFTVCMTVSAIARENKVRWVNSQSTNVEQCAHRSVECDRLN